MTDWKLILLQLRKYKKLSVIADEVGMSHDRLRNIISRGKGDMLYENGKKLIDLHERHVKCTSQS